MNEKAVKVIPAKEITKCEECDNRSILNCPYLTANPKTKTGKIPKDCPLRDAPQEGKK